jgi:hypothetical protein
LRPLRGGVASPALDRLTATDAARVDAAAAAFGALLAQGAQLSIASTS